MRDSTPPSEETRPPPNTEELPVYRPISNLSFLSKLIERLAISQLVNHLSTNDLLDEFQSAYRPGHSTETAIIRVQDDILRSIDRGESVCLVMLDLSAAFDTVDHHLLLQRLSHLGVRSSALEFIRSYLCDRLMRVSIGECTSSERSLPFGVPQGAPWGPILYLCYTLPVGQILRRCGIRFHLYADDTQLYISIPKRDGAMEQCLKTISDAVSQVKSWMETNKLRLNDDKTEVIFFSTRPSNLPSEVKLENVTIKPASQVKNLGVVMNNALSFDEHITEICRVARFHLYRLRRIKHYLTLEAKKLAVHALITSRLDFSNALLFGLPVHQIARLQAVQNAAARFITGTRKFDHITPSLVDLHWLPIPARIQFRILCLVYRCLFGSAPPYLSDLLQRVCRERCLRSNTMDLLVVPRSRTVRFGDRAFSIAAPRLWNSLPSNLRAIDSFEKFRRELKTHLFVSSYF